MIHWLRLLETNKPLSFGQGIDNAPKDLLSPDYYVSNDVFGDSSIRPIHYEYKPREQETLISIYDIQYNAKF